MKITIWCDDENAAALNEIKALNPQIKSIYFYEALLSHILANRPESITTARAGHKVPAGMKVQLLPISGPKSFNGLILEKVLKRPSRAKVSKSEIKTMKGTK